MPTECVDAILANRFNHPRLLAGTKTLADEAKITFDEAQSAFMSAQSASQATQQQFQKASNAKMLAEEAQKYLERYRILELMPASA